MANDTKTAPVFNIELSLRRDLPMIPASPQLIRLRKRASNSSICPQERRQIVLNPKLKHLPVATEHLAFWYPARFYNTRPACLRRLPFAPGLTASIVTSSLP
jgi:hypothetical protein